MAIEVISIGSSSSGNSYIIMAGSRTILLDVGLTAKKITGALEHFDIAPEEVDAVLVTHEHVDHVRSVRAISRKCCNAVFFTSRGTYDNTANFGYVPEERLQIVAAGDTVELDAACINNAGSQADNEVFISVFPLSHDAKEPLGFTVSYGGEKLAVVTDTGIITDEIFEAVKDADKFVFESNHDEHLLMFGGYPYYVKQRIKSDHGHLANDYAGTALSRILCGRSENTHPVSIMLAHLSENNNLPLYAGQAVEQELKDSGFERGVHYNLSIAAKETLTIMK